MTGPSQDYTTAVAIIGMAGRFPGARNTTTFWQNIADGVCSIRRFSDDELLAAGVDQELLQNPNYVKAGTVIDEIDRFDAAFFGYPPREAELMDPQHRLFLECAWEALEDAAYNPEAHPGLVGVFAGSGFPTYLAGNLWTNPEVMQTMGSLQSAVGNERDSLASTVSYKLNLRGPSIAVQSFCSTSLVAVHLACQSLITYECDMALAGGVALTFPHGTGYLYEEGGIVSPDGVCRTFDASAQGSVMGEGTGIVVLKRMKEALQDGDRIYAVIRGSATNNDGLRKVGYTAPGLGGQTSVILNALNNAGVKPETIDYIEAHGTATELGDAIELAAMIKAFRKSTQQQQFCAIGSVKPNIGHLDRASGVTGLIKTALALKHAQLPPSLNFEQANPDIDLDHSPFYVNTQLTPWPRTDARPRRAGVSSFGLGGTNVHVVLEEAPTPAPTSAGRPVELLLLSAKTPSALETATANLRQHLLDHPEQALADVAYTLQIGRAALAQRRMVVVRDRDDALAVLAAGDPQRMLTVEQTSRDRPMAFVLGGVGEHYVGLAQALYVHEPAFRATIDQCSRAFQPLLGHDLRTLLWPADTSNGNGNGHAAGDLRALLSRAGVAPSVAGLLAQTALAQPAVFMVEYALAQLLMGWGLQPQALLGYSLGEYVAATLAGVLSLDDALRLVATRAQLIQTCAPGAMLAVALPEAMIQPYLSAEIALAAVNGPHACVLAGPSAALDALAAQLTTQEIACRAVATTHAFHSPMLAPVAAQLTALVQSLTLHPPQIPYMSNVTGTWITDAEATDPTYWARHLVSTVRFGDGIAALLERGEQLVIEVGPGAALGSFVKQHPACPRTQLGLVFSTLPAAHDAQDALTVLHTTLGKLWLAGGAIDWPAVHADAPRRRLSLPTYPFERQRFWVAPGKRLETGAKSADAAGEDAPREPDLADWFYTPSWKRTASLDAVAAPDELAEQHWLILADECGVGAGLTDWLDQRQQHVSVVTPGTAFSKQGAGRYTVRPSERSDYQALLQDLQRHSQAPAQIVHSWMVTPATDETDERADIDQILEHGFYSLFALTQALNDQGIDTCQLSVVSNNMQDVTDTDRLSPAKATVIGPCNVIPQEYVNISCRSIDVALPSTGMAGCLLIEQLASELTADSKDYVVALRGSHRWTRAFEAVKINDTNRKNRLRQQGVYLLTGGLGGIALALADYLFSTVEAKLVLVGRSALPPRASWPALLAAPDTAATLRQRITQVQALEARGAEVLVLQADVADAAQIGDAVQQATAHFGTIHGVFHTAGIPGAGLISLKTPEIAASELAAKVQGTVLVADAVRDLPLDFLVLFSSLSSVTGGGPGQIAYSAANAFLDAYARRHSHEHGSTIALSWGEWLWDAWNEGLQGFPEEIRHYLIKSRETYGISFTDGLEALRRALACNLPHVFISTRDLTTSVAGSRRFSISTIIDLLQQQRQLQPRYPRPVLATSYISPRNDLERTLVAIWGDVLGIEEIGIYDNFFEMGGNSLLGMDLVARVRKELKTEQIAPQVLYEAPTVGALAEHLQQPSSAPLEDWGAQTDKRKEKLKQLKRRAQTGAA